MLSASDRSVWERCDKNDKTIDRKRVSDVVFEQPEFFELSKWDNSSGCKKIYPEKPGGTEEGGAEAMRCGSRTFFWKNITRSFVMKYGIFIQMRKSAFSA